MTSLLVLTPLLLLGLCLALAIPVLAKLFRKCDLTDIPADWLEEFSVSTYHPMQGLLAAEDFNFLSRQPGFDLSLYRKLKRDRLKIFRQYLHRAIRDFNKLYAVAMALIPNAPTDCSDLAKRLIWLRLRFSFSVARAELSYCLCLLGFRSLAVRSLLQQLEEMSAQLTAISALQPA